MAGKRSCKPTPTSEINGVVLEITGCGYRLGLDTSQRLIPIYRLVDVGNSVTAQQIEKIPAGDAQELRRAPRRDQPSLVQPGIESFVAACLQPLPASPDSRVRSWPCLPAPDCRPAHHHVIRSTEDARHTTSKHEETHEI